jgi:hypothetical protein
MTIQTGYYAKGLDITPSDTINIRTVLTGGSTLGAVYPDAIYVGGAGTVTVVWQDDTTTAFTCVAGQILPVKVKRVNNTGTAATLLRALYYV